MFNCPNCGYKFQEDAKFCPACGSSIERQDSFNLQNSVHQPNFSDQNLQQDPFQQNSYEQQGFNRNPQSQPYQQQLHPSRFGAQNHIKFVFISSLVFVIFFAIRSIATLGSFSELSSIDIVEGARNLYNLTVFSGFVTFITFAGILTVLILAAKAKNPQSAFERRINLSKKLFILTITSLLLGIIYMISEILILIEISDLVAQGLLDSEYVNSMNSQVLGSLFFDVMFIAFGIANIIKSKLFTQKLEESLKEEQR